jgi:hypothetical protein
MKSLSPSKVHPHATSPFPPPHSSRQQLNTSTANTAAGPAVAAAAAASTAAARSISPMPAGAAAFSNHNSDNSRASAPAALTDAELDELDLNAFVERNLTQVKRGDGDDDSEYTQSENEIIDRSIEGKFVSLEGYSWLSILP